MPPIRLHVVALVLSLCVARPSHAQTDGSGRIEGTVMDSVHARPLAGARVIAVGTGRRSETRLEATTDSAGRYRIDSLPAGRYFVGFENSLLDSLEIALPPREAVVAPLAVATVDLAMPPAAKLRAAVCRDTTLAEGTGVIYGHAVHAETENSLTGGVIALQWRDLSFDRKKLRAATAERTASAAIDDGGWYRACGVPTGTWVSMQVQVEDRVGPVLRTRIDDTLGIVIRHLSLSVPAPLDSLDTTDGTVIAPFTGTATLTGVVHGAGDLPLSSAEVRVRGARNAGVTDAQGSFTVSGLPAGTHELEVRRIGYAEEVTTVDLRSGATTKRDVRMQRIVNLDSVRIVATRTRYPEFSEHRKSAVFGHFLGPEDIQRRHAVRTSDLVRQFGGFLVDNSRGRSKVVSARGAFSSHPCIANVVIDGFSVKSDPDAFSVDDLLPVDVGAIEVYKEGEKGPPEYDSGCGSIVIWTRR